MVLLHTPRARHIRQKDHIELAFVVLDVAPLGYTRGIFLVPCGLFPARSDLWHRPVHSYHVGRPIGVPFLNLLLDVVALPGYTQ